MADDKCFVEVRRRDKEKTDPSTRVNIYICVFIYVFNYLSVSITPLRCMFFFVAHRSETGLPLCSDRVAEAVWIRSCLSSARLRKDEKGVLCGSCSTTAPLSPLSRWRTALLGYARTYLDSRGLPQFQHVVCTFTCIHSNVPVRATARSREGEADRLGGQAKKRGPSGPMGANGWRVMGSYTDRKLLSR